MASKLEIKFQGELVSELKLMFPYCFIQRNDPLQNQGIPDLMILFRSRWAFLEVKRSSTSPPRPNQPWYVEYAQTHSFGAFIYPENAREVLTALREFFNQP